MQAPRTNVTIKRIASFWQRIRKPVWNNTSDYKNLLLPIAFSKAISKTEVDCRAVYAVT